MLDVTRTEPAAAPAETKARAVEFSDLESVVCELKGLATAQRLILDHNNTTIVENEDEIDALERLADEIYILAKKAHDMFYALHDNVVAARGASH